MVTGDNILTAISVARDCKLLQPGVTVIKVEAHKVDSQLNVSYTIEDAPETQVNDHNTFLYTEGYCLIQLLVLEKIRISQISPKIALMK